MYKKASSEPTQVLEVVALLVLGLCTICIVGWILWWFQFGIDFADEGFYLVWLSDPFKYSVSLSQFGYIYHPLYTLLNGNIANLRQANGLITFLLAWILSFAYLTEVFGNKIIDLTKKCVIAAAIATASLCFFTLWLPTPSYNSLAFQALILSMIGLLLAKRHLSLRSLIGWTLIGVGGWLTFMAKPTSAAALGLLAFLYLVSSRKLNILGLSLSLLLAALLILLFAIQVDGSVHGFLERLSEGIRLASLLSPSYDAMKIVRLDRLAFNRTEANYLFGGIIGIITLFYISQHRNWRSGDLWIAFFSLIVFIILAMLLGVNWVVLKNTLSVHLIMLCIPVALMLIAVAQGKLKQATTEQATQQWSLFLILITLPYAFAFGTGGNYWTYAGFVSLFWVLAGIGFVEPVNFNGRTFPLISIAICVELLTVFILLAPMQEPYYQPHALRDSKYRLEFGRRGSTLTIPDSYGRYISNVIDEAKNGGFEPGTPVIDLTGHSPGVLYALQASSAGSPWIYGNFVNARGTAEIVTVEILKSIDCGEISRSWLLLEPGGPVSISSSTLNSAGIEVHNDYIRVAAFSTVSSLGGFGGIQQQELFKPAREISLAKAECETARKRHPN